MSERPTHGDRFNSPSFLSGTSVRKDVRGGGDAEDAADPLLPMWVHSQLENDSSTTTSTFSDDSSSIEGDNRQAPSGGAVGPMQVQVLRLDVSLSAQKSGSRCTPLNGKAAAFVPRMPTAQTDSSGDQRTTVMMRNLPTTFSRARLIDLIDSKGFEGQFDLIYLPMDFASTCNFGYAFVNMTTHEHALRFFKVFHGFASWPSSGCRKVCAVGWGEVQGLRANIGRYHNSAIMRKQDVPEDYKPALFQNGRQIPFPRKTSHSKAMSQRSSAQTGRLMPQFRGSV